MEGALEAVTSRDRACFPEGAGAEAGSVGVSQCPDTCPLAWYLQPLSQPASWGAGGDGKEGNPRAACSWARNNTCYGLNCIPSKVTC